MVIEKRSQTMFSEASCLSRQMQSGMRTATAEEARGWRRVCEGWEIGRLWFYLLSSALLFLAGIQLVIYWLLLRILEELSQRDLLTKHDMGLG